MFDYSDERYSNYIIPKKKWKNRTVNFKIQAKNPKYENFGFWGYFIKCKNIIFSGENF